jgi:hypothetical protein
MNKTPIKQFVDKDENRPGHDTLFVVRNFLIWDGGIDMILTVVSKN